MADEFIPVADLHAQYLSLKEEIDHAIAGVIATSAFIRGESVERFEEGFARLLGARHCVSCGNGTDAIYILMQGLGVRPGDEVITTAHSWISTSETITQAGGKVVFCDTTPDTFTIDPEMIAALIGPRTVGIIPVHLFGHPADMDPIMRLARQHNLWVIEDCAQAHLAKYKGRTVGTIGDASSFSFYPGKNLGAMGDAGAMVTNDQKLADWCSLYARHGGKGEHVIEGINSRMDGIQAAVLNVKLPHLSRWTARRREIAGVYGRSLEDCGSFSIPAVRADVEHAYHLYVVKTAARGSVIDRLRANRVGFSINYPKALPFYPAYSRLGHGPADFKNAHANQEMILSIPMYPELTEEKIARVVGALKQQ